MGNKFFIIVGVVFYMLLSCSKDKDEVPPTINVHTPVNGQVINGIDTVTINATISDDRNIEVVSVSLNDVNKVPVQSTITKKPNSRDYELNISYLIDDVHLLSGIYYFDINASDGENNTHQRIEITLNETPKAREGIFVFSNNGSITDISVLDNTYNGGYYTSINGDFLGSAINSYDQQLIHTSSASGGITAIDLKSGTNGWYIPIFSTFKGFLYNDRHVFVGLNNSTFKGYDRFGVGNFAGNSNSNSFVENALVHEDYYYVTEQKVIASSNINLVLYWRASGVEAQQVAVGEDIVGMFSRTSNEIVLLTNDVSTMGNVIFYDIPSGLISSPFTLSIAKIDDCLEVSNGVYLVAEGGNLTLINVNSFTTLPYLNSVAANKIRYDELTNELFVINGNTVTVYDYPSKGIKGSYTHSSNIVDLNFWYNK
jgi:hypothetical protein